MKQPIFLSGYGQTRFGEWWSAGIKDLMDEAVEQALKSASCTPLDVDMVIVGNMIAQHTGGQAHLGAMASALLPHHPPSMRVESACASGAMALHTACAMLESGRAQTVLVVGVEKMTDASSEEIASALMGAADSEEDVACGLTFPGIFGLIAQRYMYEYGLTRERLNAVSARHHQNAVQNPFAQFRHAIPAADIAKSPLVADPLCMLDCSPISDGAAACILSTVQRGPVQLIASQIASDTLSLAQRTSLTSFAATKEAMMKAMDEASILRDDLRAIETHDCFSIAAVINMEDLGFAEPGEGIRFYETENLPFTLNASGGLKACGHPVAATGIKQIIDVAKSLREGKQRYGLAHNFGGAAASAAIHIIEHTL